MYLPKHYATAQNFGKQNIFIKSEYIHQILQIPIEYIIYLPKHYAVAHNFGKKIVYNKIITKFGRLNLECPTF